VINAGKRYHFIGIGGSGMSSLATVMLAGGSRIFGSDLRENAETLRLRRKGATIHLGHDERFLDEEGIDEVIVSSAIGTENVELQAAMRNKLPVVRRLHALATLLHGYTSIGIAGTHGKTTTTAMVATILRQAGKDPSYLVGAHCAGLVTLRSASSTTSVATTWTPTEALMGSFRASPSTSVNRRGLYWRSTTKMCGCWQNRSLTP
jgi:UDP-N-acetylmuramate--alanine ligase